MVESEVAVSLDSNSGSKAGSYARFLIVPPITLSSDSLDLIFAGAMLTLMGVLLFRGMVKGGQGRWKSPTTPIILCLVMVVAALIIAKILIIMG